MDYKFGTIKNLINGISQNPSGPYSELALIYDSLMSHVDYHSWASYIVSLFDRFSPGAENVLEIACGTGSLSVELHKYGYSMTCMDYSTPCSKRPPENFSIIRCRSIFSLQT